MSATQFITRIFKGRQVSILIGHGEFEFMFVVGQIAECAHLSNPSAARSLAMEATGCYGFLQLKDLIDCVVNPQGLGDWGMEPKIDETWMASSAAIYQMLLRTDSSWAPIFRDWVTGYVIPEVREIDPTQMAEELRNTALNDREQMAATIQLLERQLSAATRHIHGLQKSLENTHALLIQATREAVSLRRGVPYAGKEPEPESLLDRMQWELDQQARPWLSAQKRTEQSLIRVDMEERWWRSPSAVKKREELAKALREND